MIIKHIKTLLLLLLTFLLGAQTTHAKTEVIIPSYQKLKQSRIGIWIDLYGLRKNQYLSGYKDVGKIEKYRNKDMKNLSKQIKMFHPLK